MIVIAMPDGSQWNIPATPVTQSPNIDGAAGIPKVGGCQACPHWMGTEDSMGYPVMYDCQYDDCARRL